MTCGCGGGGIGVVATAMAISLSKGACGDWTCARFPPQLVSAKSAKLIPNKYGFLGGFFGPFFFGTKYLLV